MNVEQTAPQPPGIAGSGEARPRRKSRDVANTVGMGHDQLMVFFPTMETNSKISRKTHEIGFINLYN